jgi:carboxyl-terminal processing protease
MRDEVFNRLVKAKVQVTREQFDAGRDVIDRNLDRYLSSAAFGDSAAFRRSVKNDEQLGKALELLARGTTQRQLLALAGTPTSKKPQ